MDHYGKSRIEQRNVIYSLKYFRGLFLKSMITTWYTDKLLDRQNRAIIDQTCI